MKSDLYSSIKPIDNYVLQHYQELIKGLVLDVGCGRGKFIKVLEKSLGIESIFDLDCNMEVLRGNKDRIYGDAQFLPFRDNAFDSALCIAVLEHLETPERCIKEVNRVLKDAGYSIFQVPVLNMPLPILVPLF